MQYIDKSSLIYSSRFNSISNRLLDTNTNSYKDVGDADRAAMKNVLRDEQNGFCAYCMQSLITGTNDHIIPRSVNVRRFPALIRQGNYRHDIVHTHSWSRAVHISANGQVKYYPHDIAYGNLVLTCEECNSRKDNKEIKPIFFNNPTEVSYNADGKMKMPANAFCEEIRAYLNETANCKWRCLWYKAQNAGVTDVQICNATDKIARTKLLRQIFGREDLTVDQFRLANDSNWNLLVSFRWFYRYFQLSAVNGLR